MADIAAALIDQGVRLRSYAPGNHKALCPKCSHTRRNKTDPCLSVTIEADRFVLKCHHCGWTGGGGSDQRDYQPRRRQPKPEPKRPTYKPNPDSLTEAAIGWFAKRGISAETLRRNRVSITRAWMPGPNKETSVMAFPYLRGGEVINVKYRGPEKTFRQEKDAEKVFYGLDNLDLDGADKTLVIVEGECLSGDTELLTPLGWVRLDAYTGGPVAQWKDGSAVYVSPIAYVTKAYTGDMIRFTTRSRAVDLLATREHRVLYRHRNGEFRVSPADAVPAGGARFVRAFDLDADGVDLTTEEIRLAVAIQADATLEKPATHKDHHNALGDDGWRCELDKQRKIERLRQLLTGCGIAWSESALRRGSVLFRFRAKLARFNKVFPKSLYQMNRIQRDAFCDEVMRWDGHTNKGGRSQYVSVVRENADLVQFAFAASGIYAKLGCDPRKPPRQPQWWVSVAAATRKRGDNLLSNAKIDQSRVPHDGPVYCVQVPSGFIVTRRGGSVCVTGNCDALSLNEAGFWNVLSVPDGAPMQARPENEPIDPDRDAKFEYVWNCRDVLDKAEKIILAVDADGPGQALEEELSRRIGKDKCWRVAWPSLNDAQLKDANEVLVQEGAAVLRECIERAQPYPIASLFDAGQFETSTVRLFGGWRQKGMSTGWPALDELYTVRSGELTVVTGYPGSGKSEFIDAVMMNLARDYGWKFAVCSFENPPEEHIGKLSQKHIGLPFYETPYSERMTEQSLYQAIDWLRERVFFIRAEDEAPTIDWILDTARAAVRRYGVRGLVIDPYNEIEHKRPAGMREDEYISQLLGKVKRFCAAHDVHVWFIAHPRRPDRLDGKYPVPSLYDIAGGAHWHNKADVGIVVHRQWNEDKGHYDRYTQVHIRKVRFRVVGKPGVAKLEYDPVSGRYREAG